MARGIIIQKRLVLFSLAILVVAVSMLHRLGSLHERPIQTDELITVQNYTWVGIHPDGTRRDLRQIEDFENRGPVTLRRTLMGFYCALGRWSEPNNHVIHSGFTNLSLLLPIDTLTAARLPALGAVVLFAVACCMLCIMSGLDLAVPVVSFLAVWHPYCFEFSQVSRGYAAMLLLSVMFIILLHKLSFEPSSKWLGVSIAVVGCATFMNVVNMSIDWVLPVLLVGMFFPKHLLGAQFCSVQRDQWRATLFWVLAVIGCVGLVFLVDRLPYVYSSAQQYGVAFSGLSELSAYFAAASRMYVPSFAWALVVALGCVAAIPIARESRVRAVAVPWIIALVFASVHYLFARKLPYVRNWGFLLPLVFFGYGFSVDRLVKAVPARMGKSLVFLGALLLVFWAASSDLPPRPADHQFRVLAEYLKQNQFESNCPKLLLRGTGVAEPLSLFVSDVASPGEVVDVAELEFLAIEKKSLGFTSQGSNRIRAFSGLSHWNNGNVVELGPYRIYHLKCQRLDEHDWDGDTVAVGVWFPSFESVSLSPHRVVEELNGRGLHFVALDQRYQAKMDVYGRIWAVLVDMCSEEERTAQRVKDYRELQALRDSFGGTIALLVPADDPNDARTQNDAVTQVSR
jgi:hypothetical protein